MLSKIIRFVKRNFKNILLFLIVFLLCLLAFGVGVIVQFYIQKEPLKIEGLFSPVKLAMDISESLTSDMGVNLSGGNAFVA